MWNQYATLILTFPSERYIKINNIAPLSQPDFIFNFFHQISVNSCPHEFLVFSISVALLIFKFLIFFSRKVTLLISINYHYLSSFHTVINLHYPCNSPILQGYASKKRSNPNQSWLSAVVLFCGGALFGSLEYNWHKLQLLSKQCHVSFPCLPL